MRLTVSGDGVRIGHKLYSDIDRRLEFSLGRFGPAIRQVVVRVVDISSPRGGLGKRCRITVALSGAGTDNITVDYSDDIGCQVDSLMLQKSNGYPNV